ncbi:ectoine synthase [Mesorhizobium sp. M0933]
MHYRNHLEAVYCISGTGSIEDSPAHECDRASFRCSISMTPTCCVPRPN